MNKLDKDYQNLLKDIQANGVQKSDRTGTGTVSVFGRQIRHNMRDGFPLLTTKRMYTNGIATELKWFLRGDTNIKFLVDNGCNIWNGDAYKNYRNNFEPTPWQFTPYTMDEFINEIKTNDEFAQKWGELGAIYGKQWREWGARYETNYILGETKRVKPGIDQLKNLIDEIKSNPDSRRLMVSAWNIEQLDDMVLPPCHYGFQVYTQERDGKRYISLMWNQRSVDTFLGLPFNIASYGLLLELIAREVGMIADELIGNLGDVHIYNDHKLQVKEQLARQPRTLPKLTKLTGSVLEGDFDYTIEYYDPWPAIKAPLSN
jgi:thymidylate synthase